MTFQRYLMSAQLLAQRVSLSLIVLVALTSLATSCLAAFGVIPWLSFTAGIGDTTYENAGMIAQIGFTIFAVALCFFLPMHMRVMALEKSHRNFNLGMEDVARAYWLSHQADREDTFKIGSEFDSVRERIQHLRDHADLDNLEPEVLELAAQMSHQARDLAQVYSKDKVDRARLFLKQRQQEIEEFESTIHMANSTLGELKRWLLQVETEEKVVTTQLEQLERDLRDVLPLIGFDLEKDKDFREDKVVDILKTRARKKAKTAWDDISPLE